MAVCLRDANAAPEDQNWIRTVYHEYVDELAAVASSSTGVFPLFGEHGPRDAELLARWFRDKRSHPLMILDGPQPVGFALVSRPLMPASASPPEYRLADFFIRRAFRRRGVGRVAAALIFGRFSGRWLITENATNGDAVTFWRTVLRDYTAGRYEERFADGEVRQTFDSPAHPRR